MHAMGLAEPTLQECAQPAQALRGFGQLLQPSEAASVLALDQACGPFVTCWMAQRHASMVAAAQQAHRCAEHASMALDRGHRPVPAASTRAQLIVDP